MPWIPHRFSGWYRLRGFGVNKRIDDGRTVVWAREDAVYVYEPDGDPAIQPLVTLELDGHLECGS